MGLTSDPTSSQSSSSSGGSNAQSPSLSRSGTDSQSSNSISRVTSIEDHRSTDLRATDHHPITNRRTVVALGDKRRENPDESLRFSLLVDPSPRELGDASSASSGPTAKSSPRRSSKEVLSSDSARLLHDPEEGSSCLDDPAHPAYPQKEELTSDSDGCFDSNGQPRSSYPCFASLLKESLWKRRRVTMTCTECLGNATSEHTVCTQIFNVPPVLSIKVKLYGSDQMVTEETLDGCKQSSTEKKAKIKKPEEGGGKMKANLGQKVRPLDYWRTFRRPFSLQRSDGQASTNSGSHPFIDSLGEGVAEHSDRLLPQLIKRWLKLRALIDGAGQKDLLPEFHSLSKIIAEAGDIRDSPLPSQVYLGRPDSADIPIKKFTSSSKNPWEVFDLRRAVSDHSEICECSSLACTKIHKYSLIGVICSVNHTWNHEIRKVLWEIWASDIAPRLGIAAKKSVSEIYEGPARLLQRFSRKSQRRRRSCHRRVS